MNIGGAVVRRLLRESEALVFNLDKMGYASDLTSIEQVLRELGLPGVNYVGGSRQLRRRLGGPSPPAMGGGGDIEN